ncbi:MAG: hypothetical protein J0H14_22430 [Alphaproteobacteria bacterium]|nr:hypothetical protein [Alphaproteobacteria bacterium]
MSAPKIRLVIVTGGSSGRAGTSLSLAVTCSARAGLQRRIDHVQPVTEAARQPERERIPLRRRGDPGDRAPWIARRAEPAAVSVADQVIVVEGGLGIA